MFPRVSLVVLAMVVVLSLNGCGSDSSDTHSGQTPEGPSPTAQDPGDVHPTEGPHGGHLIELGNEEYHAELLHDEQAHTVTVHLLDAAGKQPVAAGQPEIMVQLFQDRQFVSYALKAVPKAGDAADTASEFQIVDQALCNILSHEDKVRGRLQVTIDQQPYTGTIEHESHDHEGHDHEGHDHEGHDHEGHGH